jgi:hypothetical protein
MAEPRAQPPSQVQPQVARVVPRAPVPAAPPPVSQQPPSGYGAAAAPPDRGLRLADYGLKEGDVISEANLERYRDLLSQGVQWAAVYGWRIPITGYKRVVPPRRYREATEKYSGQVRLGPGGLLLESYVAGMPFPNIDPNDPQAAVKIMWNFQYRFEYTDDLLVKNVLSHTGTISRSGPMNVERILLVEANARMSYIGRLFIDPKPRMPNPENVFYKDSSHPVLEPFDLRGVGLTSYRYLDAGKADDSWTYVPQLRRVRRLSTAQRSDALFGQDTDADSFYGYNGHVAWMNYRLLGQRVLLAVTHGQNVFPKFQEPEDWVPVDVWEPRPFWVVEATAKVPQYAYGKRIIFIDQEGWTVPLSDIYDRAGQLWKAWVSFGSWRKEDLTGDPKAPARYEDEMYFANVTVMLDTQLAHATKYASPVRYINMGQRGGLTEDFFTIAHLIKSGS